MIATLLNNLSFIDFLDFSGVSISAVVPELVTEVKLLHYIYAKERFLNFLGGKMFVGLFRALIGALTLRQILDI